MKQAAEGRSSPWNDPITVGDVVRNRLGEWRHTWWFRHAHHPLCTRYSSDVLTVGKLQLCRSCTVVYGAIAIGTLAFILGSSATSKAWPMLFCALAVAAAFLSHPFVYRRLGRRSKDAARGLLGLLIAAWIVSAFGGHPLLAGVSLPVLLLLHRVYGRLRQSPEARVRCRTCPEYREDEICSGFVRQAEVHRRLEEAWSAARTTQVGGAHWASPKLAREDRAE